MANPFVALESVPVMATITDMLQRQANLKQTETQTNIANAHLNLLNQQQQMEQQYRDAILKGIELDPSKNNPNTTSIADGDQGQLGQAPASSFITSLQNEKKQVAANIKLAQQYPYSEEAQKNLKLSYERMDHIDTNLNKALEDQSKYQQQDLGKVANMLQDVSSAADLAAVRDFIGQTKGRNAAMAFDRQFPHDPNTGEMLWNDPAKKVAKNYLNSALGAKDKMELADKDRDYALKSKNEEREVNKDKEEAKFHDAEVANQRAGIAARLQMHKETLAASGIKYNYKEVKDTQTAIDKLATDAKLGDFKAASDIAKRVEAKLVDPAQGYTSVTPEDARQLVEQAKRLQQNFRSFGSAGKMQESEIKNMNSFLEGYEKWVQSIGKGDPILAKDQMLNLTETMNKVYNDRNAEQVKQELQRTNILTGHGGRPDFVSTRGNIDDLKDAGRAFEVTVSGKQYLAIVPAGKTKKDLTKNDLFEIPQAPKAPSFVPVPE